MNARSHREYSQRSTLRANGWDVPKADGVRFNSGSETLEHYLSKCAIAWVAKREHYRVASEVPKDGVGEIDLILYAAEDPPVAVECENGWQDDVLEDKLQRYVRGEPLRDIYPVEVTEMPDVTPLQQWAEGQI